MNGITLIVSYPKSGNTWFRAFISAIQDAAGKVDLDDIGSLNCADRRFLSHHLGVSSSDLSPQEFCWLRPRIYEFIGAEQKRYLKVHDALLPPMKGAPLPFSPCNIRNVIYLVRDPRDIAVSFSHHLGKSIDQTIVVMGRSDYVLGIIDPIQPQFPQFLSSWSGHVSSWLDSPYFRLHLVRYEDLCADAVGSFSRALDFLGIEYSPDGLSTAIAATAFEALRSQERKHGFVERSPKAEYFFRSGKAGSWTGVLSKEQEDKIVTDHSAVMRLCGYLR